VGVLTGFTACFGRLRDGWLIDCGAVVNVAETGDELWDEPPTLRLRAVEPRFTLWAVIVETLAFEIVEPMARYE